MNARIDSPYFFASICADLVAQRAYQDRIERSDNAAVRAYSTLRDEMLAALLSDPCKQVQTPGWPAPTAAAVDVVFDDLSAEGDKSLHELLCIVGMCARGEMTHETHLRAAALVASLAAAHARFHRDDLAEQLEAA